MRQKSHSDSKKTVGKYIVYPNQVLGEGSFGKTCLAKLKQDSNQKIACKILNKQNIQTLVNDLQYIMQRVRQQVNVWKQLDHPNIVKFLASQQTKNNIYFFQQLCPDGSLENYISRNRFGINPELIIKFSKQIICGCDYLHSRGTVHRDIKPANIFLKGDQVKIGDFGLARVVKKSEYDEDTMKMFLTFAGTLHFMAPEILKHEQYSPKCDVWSVGVTLYILFTNELPYNIKNKDQSQKLLLEKITNNKLQFDHKIFKQNEDMVKILIMMLQIDEQKRPKISEIKDLVMKI